MNKKKLALCAFINIFYGFAITLSAPYSYPTSEDKIINTVFCEIKLSLREQDRLKRIVAQEPILSYLQEKTSLQQEDKILPMSTQEQNDLRYTLTNKKKLQHLVTTLEQKEFVALYFTSVNEPKKLALAHSWTTTHELRKLLQIYPLALSKAEKKIVLQGLCYPKKLTQSPFSQTKITYLNNALHLMDTLNTRYKEGISGIFEMKDEDE